MKSKKPFSPLNVVILLGLIFLALIALTHFPDYGNNIVGARLSQTKANLKMLRYYVEQYNSDMGHYPSNEEGLNALTRYLSQIGEEGIDIPTDGWGNRFVYRLTPNDKFQFEIVSYGADGVSGGTEYNADLSCYGKESLPE